MKRYIVWFFRNNQFLGYRDTDDEGQPLTKRKANKIIKEGNAKAQRLGRDEFYQLREVNG